MTKHILFIIFSLLSISVFFISCEDEAPSDALTGTWDYTRSVTSNCMNANDNGIINYSGDGDCETIDNVTTCYKYSLVMNSGNYTINKQVTEGGNQIAAIEEEGTYKFQDGFNSNVIFCTDIICRTTNYTIANNTLSLESVATDTECTTMITAEKR